MKIETIDTRHGSLNKQGYSNGNTLPYTGTPFGMNYFVLQNQHESNWFFDPTYPITQGFRLSHQPSPWMGDYSWLLFTPVTGEPRGTGLDINRSSFKVSEAIFQPHKMVIESLQYRLKTTLVPTTRGAKFRFEKYGDKPLGLLLTAEEDTVFKVEAETNRLIGIRPQKVNDEQSTLNLHFVLDFPNTVSSISLNQFENEKWNEASEIKRKVVWVELETKEPIVEFSLATSFIGLEQALLNLKREVIPFSIVECEQQSLQSWESLLGKIQVKDRNHEKVRHFNQYLYRMFLFPQTMFEEDENGHPIHFDMYNEVVKSGKFYTNNGFWDTYRTVYPLFSLILPEKYQEILEGIKHFFEESGHLPKWMSPDERGLMPGTLINAVIADASIKGLITEEDNRFFLDAMVKEATTPPKSEKFGRAGVEDTLNYGYVTNEKIENVNQTQDNAYSDFCIRQVANVIENFEIAKQFEKSAFNYQNLFDENTGFLRAKDEKGNFSEKFVPEDWGFDYTEGSAWQNALAFYHDNQGYINLLGGKERFLEHLTTLANQKPIFEIGNYGMEIHEISELAIADFGQIAISNQPSFHIPYLYTYAEKPEYTQHLVKQLCSHTFKPGFDGFPGDEDNGSMSGWVIFSHLGFYPVTPGTTEYVLGIPQFDEMTIHLPNDKTFNITVEGNVPQYSFVKNTTINEEAYDKLYLSHDDIMLGGNMHVSLGLLPVEKKYKKEQLPFSLTNEVK